MAKQIRSGFTLIETAAVIAVGTVAFTQLAPMANKARLSARGAGSASNLMQIGQAAGMYGVDNADRIPSYSWNGGAGSQTGRYTLPDGLMYTARSDIDGAGIQMTEILQRRTGRIDGDFKIDVNTNRLWHRRWSHLVLLDYMNSPFPDALFIDPADANQLAWSANPLDYALGSTVPYANDVAAGFDPDNGWSAESVRQRWAFASSYQTVPAAWQSDGFAEPSYTPVSETPHLFQVNGFGQSGVELSDGRRFSEVRFPTAKVYMFEEFDREQAGDPYFGYDHARPEKLMFDGSVNTFASGDANISVNNREGKTEWRQTYVPLDTFPVPLGGLGDDTLLSQRFRWTFAGLQGMDYPTHIMPSNQPSGRRR